MNLYSKIEKYWDDIAWKQSWKEQIKAAVAHRELEDALVQDLRDALRDAMLAPKECAEWLAYWAARRPGLAADRLLVDLYTLLPVCNPKPIGEDERIDTSRVKILLETLANDKSLKESSDKRDEGFAKLCGAMVCVLGCCASQPQDQANEDKALFEAIKTVKETAYSLAHTYTGIAGADELHAFYIRAYEFLDKLQNARRRKSRDVFVLTRQPVAARIKPLEAAQRWLDRFAVDAARKDIAQLSVALFWFYVQKAKKALEQGWKGTVIEHQLCTRLTREAEKACKDLSRKFEPVVWLDVGSNGRLVYHVANWGGRREPACSIQISNTPETHHSQPSPLDKNLVLEPFGKYPDDADEYPNELGPNFLRGGKNLIEINLCDDDQHNSAQKEYTLYVPPRKRPAGPKYQELVRQHKDAPRFREWLARPPEGQLYEWESKVIQNLQADEGRAKVVYGMPRVGKTTGLDYIRENLVNGGWIPIYVNLEMLLPGDEDIQFLSVLEMPDIAGQVGDMLKRQIRDTITRLHLLVRLCKNILDEIENVLEKLGVQRDAGWDNQLIGVIDPAVAKRLLTDYFDNRLCPILAARSAKLVILVDEWSVLWKLQPEMARQVEDLLGVMARLDPSVRFVYCATGIVDRSLTVKYPLMAEMSFAPIAATPLMKEEQVKKALTDWLKPERPEDTRPDFCYDDLAVQLITHYTGGHPLLLQVFAQHLIESLNEGSLALPISWQDVEQMWKPLLSKSVEAQSEQDQAFARFRMDMYGALETIWLGISEKGIEDREKLRRVLEGESWAYLQQMLDCGLVRPDRRQRPVLGIAALEPWYRQWLAEQKPA